MVKNPKNLLRITRVQPICFKFSAGFLYSNSIIDHISEAGSPLKIYTVLKPPKGISTFYLY